MTDNDPITPMIIRTFSSSVHAHREWEYNVPKDHTERHPQLATSWVSGPMCACTYGGRTWPQSNAVPVFKEPDANPLCRIYFVSCIWHLPRLWLYKGILSYESSAPTHNTTSFPNSHPSLFSWERMSLNVLVVGGSRHIGYHSAVKFLGMPQSALSMFTLHGSSV